MILVYIFKILHMIWFLCLMAYQPSWDINTKAILLEEQHWHYLTLSWEDMGFNTFPKGICPKVNVIARLEFELITIPQSRALNITPQGHPLFCTWITLVSFVGGGVLFTNPSARAGYDTRSIFKRSLTGLNSEFSFS